MQNGVQDAELAACLPACARALRTVPSGQAGDILLLLLQSICQL